MGPLLALLAGLVLAAPRVEAAPSAESVARAPLSARTASGLEIVADVRPNQLHGRPILVSVAVRNPGKDSKTFPDLTSRPHLVHFDLTQGGARLSTRHTTPPAQDTDDRWIVNPAGERQVLLEIPSSAAFKADSLDLKIRVLNGEETVTLGPVTLALAWPDPAGAHLVPDTEVTEGVGWMTPWVQRSASGADLYLDVLSAPDPTRRGDQWFLAHLDGPVSPRLSASRPTEARDRHVYWQAGARSLWYLRLQGLGARHAPRRVDLPWPAWELLARGISDPQGGLHVPVWIPAPGGRGGEVRVVSIDPQGTPYFRIVVRMDERPQAWCVADAAGQARLLLLEGGNLDLYTLVTTPGATRPAAGLRLLPPRVRKSPEGEPPADAPAPGTEPPPPAPTEPPLPTTTGALFATLPDTPEQPGGLAIFVWSVTGTTQRLLSGAWIALQGHEIARIEGVALPGGSEVRAVIPVGYQPLLAVTRDAGGQGTVLGAGLKAPVALGALATDEAIRANGQGNLVRFAIRPRTGVTATLIPPPR